MKKMPAKLFVTYDEDDKLYSAEPEASAFELITDYGKDAVVGVYELKGMKKIRRSIIAEDV